MKNYLARISTGITLAVLGASNAFASDSIPQLRPENTSGANPVDLEQSVSGIVGTILNFVFFGIGIAALLYLLWAGYKYITAGGDTKKAGEARQAILNAVIGIAIVVSAYAIINFAFGLGNAASNTVQDGQALEFR